MTATTIETALRNSEGPAVVAYLVGGYPNPEQFKKHLITTSQIADVVEIGVPFSDPLADGLTIQTASAKVLKQGINLCDLFQMVEEVRDQLQAPIVLMSYLNPLLAFGVAPLSERAESVGISGFIIPDLPEEESAPIRDVLSTHQLALIPLITPITPPERVEALSGKARGFVYAVTRTGVTGGTSTLSDSARRCLRTAKRSARVPVLAGFGVRENSQVREISTVADGVIVGSALIECIDRGDSISNFLTALRPTPVVGGLA